MFDPKEPDNHLPLLPPKNLRLSDKTYMQLSKASRALSSLNTYVNTNTNNVGLLVLGSFLLKEGVASSAIENINTTLESVLLADITIGKISEANKEVLHYRQAVLWGIEQVDKYNAIITNSLIAIQSMIEPYKTGIRKIPGTVLMNGSGETIYTPPVGESVIRDLLSNLEQYINSDDGIDPLIKIAVIHYQFESIHPFPDGNGRTGRIMMILYLVLTGLLNLPILYISEYINNNKVIYYNALQGVRKQGDRDSLIYYILIAVEKQSVITKNKLEAITLLIQKKKHQIDDLKLKIPGTFIDYFFDRPYSNISIIEKDGKYTWKTIKKYIDQLLEHEIIKRIPSDNKKEQNYVIPEYAEILMTGKIDENSSNLKKGLEKLL